MKTVFTFSSWIFVTALALSTTAIRAGDPTISLTQFGTPEGDAGSDVSTDGRGNVYIAGQTEGDLGGPNAGGQDVFLVKLSESPS